MRRVSDMTPDQLNTVITDELRVVTENPYEYQVREAEECLQRRGAPFEASDRGLGGGEQGRAK